MLDNARLQKLKIDVYTDRDRSGAPDETFETAFNPTSVAMQHENVFARPQAINTSGKAASYSFSLPVTLSLALVFDGTGALASGLLDAATQTPVSEQVEQLLSLCFDMDGDIHEPKFLKLRWGEGRYSDFDCRLQSVDIRYTAIDRDGNPQRAELDAVFVEDLAPEKRLRQEGKNSPDVTHRRVAQAGDNLPLLCKSVYGSSRYYLQVAAFNELDDFRNLTPGQIIYFPPLAG